MFEVFKGIEIFNPFKGIKWLDYLIKIFKENEYKDDDIYNYENDYVLNNISLLDLIKTCLKLGFQGFYKTGINIEKIHKKYKMIKILKMEK